MVEMFFKRVDFGNSNFIDVTRFPGSDDIWMELYDGVKDVIFTEEEAIEMSNTLKEAAEYGS